MLPKKSFKEMEKRINEYFELCKGELLVKDGEPVLDKQGKPIRINEKPPTVTGLALAAGFNSRRELLSYRGNEKFGGLLMRAISRCEEYAESKLYDSSAGIKYHLVSNFEDWGDDSGTDLPGDEIIEVSIK